MVVVSNRPAYLAWKLLRYHLSQYSNNRWIEINFKSRLHLLYRGTYFELRRVLWYEQTLESWLASMNLSNVSASYHCRYLLYVWRIVSLNCGKVTEPLALDQFVSRQNSVRQVLSRSWCVINSKYGNGIHTSIVSVNFPIWRQDWYRFCTPRPGFMWEKTSFGVPAVYLWCKVQFNSSQLRQWFQYINYRQEQARCEE